MQIRKPAWGLTAALLASLAVPGAGHAGGTVYPSFFCSDTAEKPCIVSATLNGAPVTASHPDFVLSLQRYSVDGSRYVRLHVLDRTDGDFELGAGSLDDVWVVRIHVGNRVPRVVFAYGTDVAVRRFPEPGGQYEVRITATPVVLAGGCDLSVWPWTCPTNATEEWEGFLDAVITDYGSWDDLAQRNSMYGMTYATNISSTSLPPEIVPEPATGEEMLLLRLANPHARMDGTPFVGELHLRIPNAFLRTTYGVDAPETMSGVSLAPGLSGSGGGTIVVSQESTEDAMLVDGTGLTFSTRVLRIRRGIVVPTRPGAPAAKRVDARVGRVRFTESRPRGMRIRGYLGRCEARQGDGVVKARSDGSPLTFGDLQRGVSYDCRVRALSKAGPGPWSSFARIPARAG